MLDELRALRQAAAALERLEPSPAVWFGIRQRLARPEHRYRRWVWAGATAAAAALLVVVIAGRTSPKPGSRFASRAAALPRTREAADAGLAVHYRDYLAGVDAAIVEIEAALAENPNNPRVRLAYAGAQTARARSLDQFCYGGN